MDAKLSSSPELHLAQSAKSLGPGIMGVKGHLKLSQKLNTTPVMVLVVDERSGMWSVRKPDARDSFRDHIANTEPYIVPYTRKMPLKSKLVATLNLELVYSAKEQKADMERFEAEIQSGHGACGDMMNN